MRCKSVLSTAAFSAAAVSTLLATLLLASTARATEGVAVSPAGRHTLAPELAVAPNGDVAVIWLDRNPVNAAANNNSVADNQADSAATTQPKAQASMAPPTAMQHEEMQHERMQHGAGAPPDRHTSSMDLWFARSSDGGRHFSAPVRVNDEPGMVWGFAVSKPNLAISHSGTIHIIFPANKVRADGKTTLVMYYTRSTDAGKTFEAPRLLHHVPDIDQSEFMDGGFTSAHAFGAIGIAPNGTVHVLWVDTRKMKAGESAAAAYTAVSSDDGRSFTSEHAALDDGVCPCCQLSIAFDAQSNMYLGSRRVTADGHRNSTVARFAAGNRAASAKRVPIGGTPWKIDGCPLKPTVVAVDGRHVYAAAYNGAESKPGVYFSASNDSGAHFGAMRALQADASVSDAPAIAIANGLPVMAWHGKTSGGKRVFWRTAARGGALLGPVQELDSPAGSAQTAALAARPDGKVQIVWQQGEQIYTTALTPQAPVAVAARNRQ